ncbi:unnamed protein product [Polarella glacialis]|uniref:Protein kinase domain-containing protein n=1 Tax=Polarella glacialis TaxID=89957 RepID=A0A813HVK2_POLGL|nr:unnamed protein product [Polarella glacialis]
MGNCKLIDFGSAKDLANPQVKGAGTRNFKSSMEEYVGTPNFMAPEVVRNLASDFRSDTWSLGCLVFQVLTGLPPFYGGSLLRVYKKICAVRLELPEHWLLPEARDLIGCMLVKDPDARLGCTELQEIQAHPYFADFIPGCPLLDRPWEGAHRRSAPVLSLEEMCIRRLGRRWAQLGARAQGFAALEGVRPQVRSNLLRLAEVQELVAGKANDGSTSSSGVEEDEGPTTATPTPTTATPTPTTRG